MTKNQVAIQYLVLKLRRRYSKHPQIFKKHTEMLNRILWRSIPIVYPNWQEDLKEIMRAIENRKQAKKRTNKYLQGMFACYDGLYFLTFTFDEECLNNTSADTRKQYVRRFLNEYTRDYYCNIDYGSEKEREHFHAVVSDKVPFDKWTHGALNGKRIRATEKDTKRVATYMRKLSNHANKLGTGKAFHKRGLVEVDCLPF